VVPEQPPVNSFYVQMVEDIRTNETAMHYRINRPYRVLYFSDRPDTLLAIMDALSSRFYQIQILEHMRLESFTISEPFKTENDLFACIGILNVTTRTSRDLPAWPKINNVNVRRI
jgi:hypothetical protein